MKPLCVEDMDKEDEAFYSCLRLAEDDFYNQIDYGRQIFFYGQLIEEEIFLESQYDEEKTYCVCPNCGSVFEIAEPKNFSNITCHKCDEDGVLVDFRDKSLPLDDMFEQDLAFMETYEDGFCLRLFKAYADYSGRDYDDYSKLEYSPAMRFFEYGREYYHDGEVKCFANPQEDGNDTRWVEVDTLDDDDFWIVNMSDDIEVLRDSPYIIDLKGEDAGKPLMHHLTKGLSYKAFRALQRYGFEELRQSMVYTANSFSDSSKIYEVLGVDYNQILATVGKDITLSELISARKLYSLNVPPTVQNINLMLQMDKIGSMGRFSLTVDNGRKIFKYLRNQENKTKNKKIGQDYVDYLSECAELNFDLSDSRVLYPTDLLKAHAHTSSLIKAQENAETENGVVSAYEKYHDLCSYDNGSFCVMMPQHCEEIIEEGAVQSHCVGKYIERVAKGEDIILFVRRSAEKDKPFYTMEIRPIMRKLDIVQCRGFENRDPSPEIRAEVNSFLVEYENWFNKRRPVFTDKTSRIYYKAVKKIDGKYISAWDNQTEYIVGQFLETTVDHNPDKVAVKGIHVASLEFAQNYGKTWDNVAILELEVDIHDIVVPDAKDQVRASRVKVLREVPFEEMGEWGAQRIERARRAADKVA